MNGLDEFDMEWHNISSPNLYYTITRCGIKRSIFTSVTVIIINTRLLFVLAPSIIILKRS